MRIILSRPMRLPALLCLAPAPRAPLAKMGFSLFGQSSSKLAAPRIADTAPSWDALRDHAFSTATGARLAAEEQQRAEGGGPAHTDAKLRLFGTPESEVRVVLYRDSAAWCPYCQKVWMLLELKQIPYRVEKINMRSYGDKPSWFLQKVRGGLLPVIELDGELVTESLTIMQLLDREFKSGPQMVPPAGSAERDRATALLALERELFSWWCTLTFQPGKGMFDGNEKQFLQCLERVDTALGSAAGPWFLGGDHPSLVDLQYISHVERMLASVAYWKGISIRADGRFKNIETWLQAFEQMPCYIATKSDYYTHVMDIPPQYGPGFGVKEAAEFEARIGGKGDAWKLPLTLSAQALEPLAPLQDVGTEAACHEAAFKLASNHVAVVRFAARGAGEEGTPRFQAPLADPYAKPNEALVPAVDTCLRHVASSLLVGVDQASDAARADVKMATDAEVAAIVSCLAYLRDRVGCPRDMGQAAAMYFRAHLNWMIDIISAKA
ncbi:hypothetical protein AB1Y20_010775 [Prymnesium parvum]|uniref:GST N-terminal domain-containing protein n=1 Tax=Prymnesium parvum TaxID=97485 RepID=A0AB34ISD6_PRYPA